MHMALKQNIVVGLNIGTTTVSVVIAEVSPDNKVTVIGVGTEASRGLRKGVVINIEATVDSISKAINQAETMAGIEVKAVYGAISGSHIKGLNSHGIVGIKNKEVSAYDVERVIEAAKAVAIPMDREVLHVLPQEFIVDNQDGVREPIGISGVRLECKVHIVTGAVASAQNIVKCANRCGLVVKDLVLSGLAASRAVVAPEEQELGVCLLDIGGGTTDITVFHNGAIRHTSVLALGGNHITNDIAAGLRTPIAAAEEIKCAYGTALVSLVRDDETVEVPSTGGRSSRILSKLVLAEIIEPRAVEIMSLVQRDLERAGCEDMLTSGIVLTGGSANLKGLQQVAEQTFNVPVRIGYPTGVGGLKDLVKSPELAGSVGLVLHAASDMKQARVSSGRGFYRLVHNAGKWLKEHF